MIFLSKKLDIMKIFFKISKYLLNAVSWRDDEQVFLPSICLWKAIQRVVPFFVKNTCPEAHTLHFVIRHEIFFDENDTADA